MNHEPGHMDSGKRPKDLEERISSGMKIPWNKEKDEVWKQLSVRISEEEQSDIPVRRILPGRRWLAAAASLALLLALASFLRLYTVEVSTPDGVKTSVQLPDGSSVQVNAGSDLSYQPYWWKISRNIYLEGEAYFDVKEGRPFKVHSAKATTEVLGTTFNVFAREATYVVTCHSGTVHVSANAAADGVTLSGGEKAILTLAGSLNVITMDAELATPGWMNDLLMFASAPLTFVLEEIERQYGIEIVLESGAEHLYSGNFSLNLPVETVLELLCRPFALQYEHRTGNIYHIIPAALD